MLLLINNLLAVLPFSKWCIIPLAVVAALIFYIVKLRRLSKNLEKVDRVNNIIWGNVQEYLFLIDRNYEISRTNYYEINKINHHPDKSRFGEVIGCDYACKAGSCGAHVSCALCLVRKQLRETFEKKGKFSNYELVMKLCSKDRSNENFYNVVASGSYLCLDNEDYVLLTIHDISREKALEKTIKKGNEKFLSVFDSLPVGCAICDKNGNLKEVNITYVDYMGIKTKSDATDVLNIFNNPCVNPEYKEMMRAGKPVSGEVKYDYARIRKEYVDTSIDGIKYFRFIVNYLKDIKGDVEFYIIIWVDNTLIHQTLKKNKAFEDMTALASFVSNIGFGSVNLVNNEQLTTPGYLKNLGLESGDHSSVFSQFSKVYPEDKPKVIDYLKKAIREKAKPFKEDLRIEINGEYHWIKQLIMQQVFDPENENIILLGVNVDISDRKETEQELEEARDKAESSDKLKSAFIANMSHEIRTPLNAIVGFSDLLADSDDPGEKKDYQEIIRYNNELLLQLISDILDLSKIEADTLEFNWSEVDINNLLRDIEQSARLKNKDRANVQIRFIPGLSDCVISTEKIRISQVITNFMTNAQKFTEEGSITLGYEHLEDGMRFYVKDTGSGIPEDKLSHIFDRFVKLNNFKQGTGLGLSICHSIVHKLGGEIGVNSEIGRGSEFWFKLPCHPLECQSSETEIFPDLKRKDLLNDSEKTNRLYTLLVAEDIEDNYRLCEVLLGKKYNLIHAWDGQQAVEMFLKYAPDAILMDIRMPNWDGYEATQAIRQMSANIPIIALTAFAFSEDKEKILSSGFDACLTKPIKKQEIFETLALFKM